eukprot:CAMPEP_0183506438 /NCGR_PEP_ID=MMETSP0371-20130417/7444_1 /TAXON_ID=268820 /ORGANISM="Peridinium aciculiferum, Strain PAER-2" /LENGTH=97 /DNA_ID=CAMNT_0025702383 /DNA_START=68 /DNA_END=363 /DNA_ORIENTATION=+
MCVLIDGVDLCGFGSQLRKLRQSTTKGGKVHEHLHVGFGRSATLIDDALPDHRGSAANAEADFAELPRHQALADDHVLAGQTVGVQLQPERPISLHG